VPAVIDCCLIDSTVPETSNAMGFSVVGSVSSEKAIDEAMVPVNNVKKRTEDVRVFTFMF
jgi:hypothetical protein